MASQIGAEQVSRQLVDLARARAKDPKKVWGIPYGFSGVDALTGGIHNEEMTILMARPGVGKTQFLGQTALNVAEYLTTPEGKRLYPGHVVKLVECEMSALSFQQRIVCYKARVSSRKVREGNLSAEGLRAYEEAAESLAGLPIEYLDEPGSLEETVKWLGSGNKPAWFAVDYIGIHPHNPAQAGASQWAKVSALSQGFRKVCKTLAPGLILAQMNREFSKRQDPRPQLTDLRDSGSLEQDAWNVFALHRMDVFMDLSTEDINRPKDATLYVLKQRNGPIGQVEMKWIPLAGAYVDVSDLAKKLEEEDGVRAAA
jgi:replicative DNA helicase